MIPGVGEVFDVGNGLISLARGNYEDAAWNFGSALPGLGNGIGVVKWGRNASKVAGHADETFEILDGVRRAKAAERVGNGTIPAKIFDAEGKMIRQGDVAIDSLRSPRDFIDVGSKIDFDRWQKTYDLTKAGSTPPPIHLTPGSRGTPIKDVDFGAGDFR